MCVGFANANFTHIFSAKILAYIPYLRIKRVNNTLTNDIVSFEQLGPGFSFLIDSQVLHHNIVL